MSFFTFFIFFLSVVHRFSSEKLPDCDVQICRDVAERISKLMDSTIDPCEDFYGFSCGGWHSTKEIPPGEEEISVFSESNKKVDSQIEAILSNDTLQTKSHLDSVKKAQRMYANCMNLTAVELDGAEAVVKFIRILGIPWPISSPEKDFITWDLYDSLINLHKNYFPATAFFMVDVSGDNIKSGQRIIKLDDSGISLQSEVYWNEPKMLDFYLEYVTSVHRLLGVDENAATEMAGYVVEVEKKISHILLSNPMKSGSHMRTNLKELQQMVPEFPWSRYLKGVFDPIKISQIEPILITTGSNLYQISRIIADTPKRNLASYMVWHAIREKLGLLSSDFRTVFNRFRFKVQNQHNHTAAELDEMFTKSYQEDKWYPRNEYCRTVTNNHFGLALMGPYVESIIDDQVIPESENLYRYLIESLKDLSFSHAWIDQNTRSNLVQKLEGLVSKIGYPSYAFNQTYIMERYKDVEISGNSLFESALNSDHVYRNKSLLKLRKSVDKSRWSMLPQTINAMYQYFQNEIVVPAGILQPPFFYVHKRLPRSLSFGSLGSILGHELTHAFDSTGRKFDKDGKVVKEWWSGASIQSFNFLSLCFQEQYSSYNVSEAVKVDGRLTLVENIADNGGIQAAYGAYMKYVDTKGPDTGLVGLGYNAEQLFFISHAQEYCSKMRKKSEELSSQVESHSPASARVTGTLSNMKEFSKAFACEPKSRMNPERKCRIW